MWQGMATGQLYSEKVGKSRARACMTSTALSSSSGRVLVAVPVLGSGLSSSAVEDLEGTQRAEERSGALPDLSMSVADSSISISISAAYKAAVRQRAIVAAIVTAGLNNR